VPLGGLIEAGLRLVAAGNEASGLSGVQILLAVIGFVVAFAAGIVCEPIRHCLFRPKLILKYDEKNGSKVITPGTLTSGQETELCYLRVRVTDKSLVRRIARNCVAYLTDVRLSRTDSESEEHLVDSIPMAWSYRRKGISNRYGVGDPPPPEERIDVPCGLRPFFDVVYTRKDSPGQFYWCFACDEPKRYRSLTNQHGEFILTLLVSAENTAPATIRLKFTWPGDWKGLKVEQL
jgi:hypothetical protein